MKFKPIAIGVENYKRIIDKNCYYIDKTLMIKDILDKGSIVNLLPVQDVSAERCAG